MEFCYTGGDDDDLSSDDSGSDCRSSKCSISLKTNTSDEANRRFTMQSIDTSSSLCSLDTSGSDLLSDSATSVDQQTDPHRRQCKKKQQQRGAQNVVTVDFESPTHNFLSPSTSTPNANVTSDVGDEAEKEEEGSYCLFDELTPSVRSYLGLSPLAPGEATTDEKEAGSLQQTNLLQTTTFREKLNSMRKHNVLCDTNVLCRQESFSAHRVILIAFSHVCAELIEKELKQQALLTLTSSPKSTLDGLRNSNKTILVADRDNDHPTVETASLDLHLSLPSSNEVTTATSSERMPLFPCSQSTIVGLSGAADQPGHHHHRNVYDGMPSNLCVLAMEMAAWDSLRMNVEGGDWLGPSLNSTFLSKAGTTQSCVSLARRSFSSFSTNLDQASYHSTNSANNNNNAVMSVYASKQVTSADALPPAVEKQRLREQRDEYVISGLKSLEQKRQGFREVTSDVCSDDYSTESVLEEPTDETISTSDVMSTDRLSTLLFAQQPKLKGDGYCQHGSPSVTSEEQLQHHHRCCHPLSTCTTTSFSSSEMMRRFSDILTDGGGQQQQSSKASEKLFLEPLLTIRIDFADPEILDVLLDYAYTGSFKTMRDLPPERFCEVNMAARKLDVVKVNVFLPEVIRQTLTSKNFLAVWDLADQVDNREMVHEIVTYVVRHLDTLWMSSDLMKLSRDRMVRMLSVASRSINLKRNVLLRAVIAWLKVDPDRRCHTHTVKMLLPFVRNSVISEDFVKRLLFQDNVVKSSPELCAELVNLMKRVRSATPDSQLNPSEYRGSYVPFAKALFAKKTKAVIANSTVSSNPSSMPPKPKKKKKKSRSTSPLVLESEICEKHGAPTPDVGRPLGVDSMASNTTHIVDPSQAIKHSTKSVSTNLTKARLSSFSPPATLPVLIIVGEQSPTRELVVLLYTLEVPESEQDVISLQVMLEDRQTIAYNDNFLLLVGGEYERKKEKMRSVFVCDIRSNWKVRLPDMHLPRSSPAVFLVNSTVYVCGGEGRYYEALSEVESLELRVQKLKWKIVPCMHSKRSGHYCVVCGDDGFVYAVGGGTNKCERYEPESERWVDMPSLPEDFSQLSPLLVLVQGHVVVFNYYRPTRLFVLDQERKSWQMERLSGVLPNWILSVSSSGSIVFALEEKQTIYCFDLNGKHWHKYGRINRSNFRPLFIAVREDGKQNASSWNGVQASEMNQL